MSDGSSDANDEAALKEWLDLTLLNAASALIVERYIPGVQQAGESADFAQLIGPFPKDTTAAMEFIEQRKAHDARDESAGTEPVEYRIRLVFAPRSSRSGAA